MTPRKVGDVHTDHQKLCLREIDDRDDAEHQRQPDRNHGIDTAQHEAIEDGLQQCHARFTRYVESACPWHTCSATP